jgi:hypothetical protein
MSVGAGYDQATDRNDRVSVAQRPQVSDATRFGTINLGNELRHTALAKAGAGLAHGRKEAQVLVK